MLGLPNLKRQTLPRRRSSLNMWEQLESFEQDVRQETMTNVMMNLLSAANKSKDRDKILAFLKNDPSIAVILGDDAAKYSERIDNFTSMEGLAADMTIPVKAGKIGAAAYAGYKTASVMALVHSAGFSSLWGLLALPMALLHGCVIALAALGLVAVGHLLIVRIARYVKKLKAVRQKGLDAEKFNDGKKYFSDYLPKYEDWNKMTHRISTLQSLCSTIINNPEAADAEDLTSKFSSLGVIIENGKVRAGSHMDKQYPAMSIESKGWNSDRLMTAVDASLELVKDLLKTAQSKDQALKLNSLGSAEKKLLKAGYKELHFWVLDLIRGVAVAAERYMNE